MIKVCFTERLIDRSVTQVGYSDPMIQNGMIIAQEIKVTLGMKFLLSLVDINILISNQNWVKCKDFLLISSINKTICSEAIISA